MNKIIKITMEFQDHIQELSGEDAEKWLAACNSTAVMEYIHGRQFPSFKWKITQKKICTVCKEEIKMSIHPETGEEWYCKCQCTLDAEFNENLWKENENENRVDEG